MTAIFIPLIVVTYGAHAAAASFPIPTYGNRAAFAAASVSARPVWPVVKDVVVRHGDQVDARVAQRGERHRHGAEVVGLRLRRRRGW